MTSHGRQSKTLTCPLSRQHSPLDEEVTLRLAVALSRLHYRAVVLSSSSRFTLARWPDGGEQLLFDSRPPTLCPLLCRERPPGPCRHLIVSHACPLALLITPHDESIQFVLNRWTRIPTLSKGGSGEVAQTLFYMRFLTGRQSNNVHRWRSGY